MLNCCHLIPTLSFQARGAAHVHGCLWSDMEIMNKMFPGITAAFKRLRESKKLIELRPSRKVPAALETEQDDDPDELPDPAAPVQDTSNQPEPEGAARQDALHQITALKNFVDTFITCSLHRETPA